MLLDIDQIATLTKYSKDHICNLVSAKKLPFKFVTSLGDKILISVIEMADYLDSKLLSHTDEEPNPVPVEVKKKIRRPRGTTKANLEIRCFQSDLRTAIYKQETQGILGACVSRQSGW